MQRITKGLDLPISGAPRQSIEDAPAVGQVGIVAEDYIGMKPTMQVEVGDRVKLGQTLFVDKKTPGVRYVSPGAGTVAEVYRGEKRRFLSIVIDLEGDDEIEFQSFQNADLSALSREEVTENLVDSALWTALRTRPYGRVPRPGSVPHSLFITAIDTQPLAADPAAVLAGNEREFEYGLQVLRSLTDGNVYLCVAPGAEIPGRELDFLSVEEFSGPHPAGLPGTHIHFLDPVSARKTAWYINYQDVLAIGRLFVTGRLNVERVISLAGPSVLNPRLLRTRLGARVDELTTDELEPGEQRVISGSVLSGRKAAAPQNFLGRYHLQVSALPEGRDRVFLGWQRAGMDKFSVKRVFASALMTKTHRFRFTTTTAGSERAMVPIGSYEGVMPLDVEATILLRSLLVGDSEQAQLLGCLELEEEDLSLCTFVCPSKLEYGPLLRRMLTQIEKEG